MNAARSLNAGAALLVVDLQNGFVSEPDELPVEGATAIIPIVDRLVPRFAVRIASQDWHPHDHGSFASRHPGVQPFDRGTLAGVDQVFWPDHCVQGTRGAAFHPDFDLRPIQAIFRKGMDPEADSYSVFADNAGRNPTGLDGYLRARGVVELVLVGLALDYCVLFTARDARRLLPDLQVTVVLDATRGPGDGGGGDRRAAAVRRAVARRRRAVTSRQRIARARPKAAVAASPPTSAVCQALRNGPAVVNRPLKYPNTRRASSVVATDTRNPSRMLGAKK
jgi:nicotinamidase/pyrazinamidase